MNDRPRILWLVLILTAVSCVVAATSLAVIYDLTFEKIKTELVAEVEHHAELVESMAADHAALRNRIAAAATDPSLPRFKDIHIPDFGRTGQYDIAVRVPNGVAYATGERDGDDAHRALDENDPRTLPMRKALDGEIGFAISEGPSGEKVMAAHHPLPGLNAGLVARIDLDEVREPFLRAGLIVVGGGGMAVLLGSLLLFRVTGPLFRSMHIQERRYAELFDNMSNGVAVYEAVDGGRDFVFKDFNRASEAIEGLERADVIGRRVTEVFPGVREFGILDVFRRVWETGESEEFPLGFYEDDRIKGWRENHIYRLPGGEVVAVYEDKTQLKETERNLRQIQKMEALGQLTGGVAHDFNNILAVIRGNLEFLEEQIDAEDGRRHLVKRAESAVDRGARLTERLLAFSRKQELAPSVLDASSVVSSMVEMLRRTLDASVAIQTVIDGEMWPVMADREQLENAILNLAVNSHRAMPDGGIFRIVMENARIEKTPDTAQEGLEPGPYVLIAVSDTGVGMSPEVREKAFEPFFTTQRGGQGSGLGLSMVYGFAKQSGGMVDIKSREGDGATVMLYLPAAPKAALDAAREKIEEDIPTGAETILVVEDDESVRELAVRNLQRLGYAVLSAPDGRMAIETARNGKTIDLLFTDVVMPGMNGAELANRIRMERRDIKVLFVSGYPADHLRDFAFGNEDVMLLRKPYTRAQLAQHVRAVLD